MKQTLDSAYGSPGGRLFSLISFLRKKDTTGGARARPLIARARRRQPQARPAITFSLPLASGVYYLIIERLSDREASAQIYAQIIPGETTRAERESRSQELGRRGFSF